MVVVHLAVGLGLVAVGLIYITRRAPLFGSRDRKTGISPRTTAILYVVAGAVFFLAGLAQLVLAFI